MSRASERELDAAGITDPSLRRDYTDCRALNAEHGKTYYLSTLLLPIAKRPYVHALYGFARWVDDVIDDPERRLSVEGQGRLLSSISDVFAPAAPADVAAGLPHELLDAAPMRAVCDTISRWDIPRGYFVAFLDSMRMDLTVTQYETYADLEAYMWGSAAVIGLQMLPILEPQLATAVVAPYAVDLGVAFQLTNFLRDVGEDLRLGRIYLPQESLRRHGVDREHLLRGIVDGPVRRLLSDEIARTRELYRSAGQGIRLLDPRSQACLRTALTLYGDILTEIERRDYRVLEDRVRVGAPRRLRVALPGLVSAARTRRTRRLALL